MSLKSAEGKQEPVQSSHPRHLLTRTYDHSTRSTSNNPTAWVFKSVSEGDLNLPSACSDERLFVRKMAPEQGFVLAVMSPSAPETAKSRPVRVHTVCTAPYLRAFGVPGPSPVPAPSSSKPAGAGMVVPALTRLAELAYRVRMGAA